jgi:hypothetical protein
MVEYGKINSVQEIHLSPQTCTNCVMDTKASQLGIVRCWYGKYRDVRRGTIFNSNRMSGENS